MNSLLSGTDNVVTSQRNVWIERLDPFRRKEERTKRETVSTQTFHNHKNRVKVDEMSAE